MARTFPDATATRLAALCGELLRAPVGYATDDLTGEPIMDFEPPLTTEEQATLAALTDVARSPVDLTPEEWETIRPQLQALRAFRQMGRGAFMDDNRATDKQRLRELYDAFTAQTIIDLALTRNG